MDLTLQMLFLTSELPAPLLLAQLPVKDFVYAKLVLRRTNILLMKKSH